MDKLVLENGKYEINFDELKSNWDIKRYGEDWANVDLCDLPCGKMLISMFYEAQVASNLREQNKKLIKRMKEMDDELADVYQGYNRLLERDGCI